MPGTLHAGTLQRWYEQLCRIEHRTLRPLFTDRSLRPNSLPARGAVYCFWWTGDLSPLRAESCNRQIELHGPGGRPVLLHLDDEWLGISAGAPIPLYVGKNADNLASRVGKHLMITQRRITPVFRGPKKQKRPTTSCQLRAGVEHLFCDREDTRGLILDNIGLSFVELDGDDHAANRFYLEDFAIGLMRPILNIDIER